ncbi:MAG: hypothetical protein K9N46_01345 [Candidatus Marinimicrobia bacterium]|nr:hypothetical protein [Candidatus Neomarinimicrobiota bacterium]MCF7827879.1 hypothetical protein [Candidatus Neomarinimicrobiota bacterium]MCF7879366.1 hypothetical protein [Candidatus Neomarinimicrobiota bacterium]
MSKKPIACDLSVFNETERERHAYLAEHFQSDVLGKEETDDGFRFKYPASQSHLERLILWIDMERRCCPFLDFKIEIKGNAETCWVSLTGNDGVKEFLRETIN